MLNGIRDMCNGTLVIREHTTFPTSSLYVAPGNFAAQRAKCVKINLFINDKENELFFKAAIMAISVASNALPS